MESRWSRISPGTPEHTALSTSMRMAVSDWPTSSWSFPCQRAALVLLRAQQPRGELLQVGSGAGILIQAAFQLGLQTESVADGQKRQHQAAGQRDPKVRTKDRRRRSEEAANCSSARLRPRSFTAAMRSAICSMAVRRGTSSS